MVDPDKLAKTIFPEEILFKNKFPKIATIKSLEPTTNDTTLL